MPTCGKSRWSFISAASASLSSLMPYPVLLGQTLRGFLRAAPPAVSASSRLRRLLAPSPAFASSEFSLRSSSDAALPLSLASIFLPDLLLPGSFLWRLTVDQRKLLARTQPKIVWLPYSVRSPKKISIKSTISDHSLKYCSTFNAM